MPCELCSVRLASAAAAVSVRLTRATGDVQPSTPLRAIVGWRRGRGAVWTALATRVMSSTPGASVGRVVVRARWWRRRTRCAPRVMWESVLCKGGGGHVAEEGRVSTGTGACERASPAGKSARGRCLREGLRTHTTLGPEMHAWRGKCVWRRLGGRARCSVRVCSLCTAPRRRRARPAVLGQVRSRGGQSARLQDSPQWPPHQRPWLSPARHGGSWNVAHEATMYMRRVKRGSESDQIGDTVDPAQRERRTCSLQV